MKIAYFVTRNTTNELFNGCLLNTLAGGTHHAQVTVMHFAEDAVYHLVEGSSTADKIQKAAQRDGFAVLACECSVKNRGLGDRLIPEVTIAHIPDFYRLAEEAKTDHLIVL